jgi:hypothetical protein
VGPGRRRGFRRAGLRVLDLGLQAAHLGGQGLEVAARGHHRLAYVFRGVELRGVLAGFALDEDVGAAQARAAPLSAAKGCGALLDRVEVGLHRVAAGRRRARGTASFWRRVK